jgi:NADH:quinone reductase (non-electrogenic)
MRERGVIFKLNTRVTNARPGSITLSSEEEIPTETFVWTAGATPNPILKALPIKHDSRGAVLVDRALAVPDYGNVWAPCRQVYQQSPQEVLGTGVRAAIA